MKRITKALLINITILVGIIFFHTGIVKADIATSSVVNNIVVDKASPQASGATINIKAEGVSPSGPLYRFWIYDGLEWKVVQEYSEKNTYDWTPTKSGEHRIWVDIKDKSSTKDWDSYKQIFYYITPTISTINTDKPSPQKLGATVNIRAESKASNALYRFWIYDGTSWSVVRDYNSSNSYSWTPSKIGTHRIWVDIKTQGSSKDMESYKQIYYDVAEKPYVKSLTTSLASPQSIENAINVKAEAALTAEPLYRFWIYDGVQWTIVQDYSEKCDYTWMPAKSGDHRIWVDIKDKNSSKAWDNYKEIYYYITPTISAINTDKPSPQKSGTTINIKAESKASNALYRFWIYDGTSWSVVRDYSSSNSYSWTPSKVGTHRIWVDIKTQGSSKDMESYKEIYYEVTEKPYVKTLVTSLASPQNVGSTINIKAEAALTAEPLYRFWIYDGVQWKVVQEYSSKNEYTWIPNKSGQHRIWVDIKDKNSTKDWDNYKEIYYCIASKTIVIDPGHNFGGNDGAYDSINGVTYVERDLNMQLASKLKTYLQNYGFKVILTREEWERSTLSSSEALQRSVNIANDAKADFFISIHHDKSLSRTINGISTHYSTYRPSLDNEGIVNGNDPSGWYTDIPIDLTPTKEAILSRDIANGIASKLSSTLGYKNLGAHDHGLYVTKWTNMPSLLVESGFISNAIEAQRCADNNEQVAKAKAIADVIYSYLR